MAITNPTSIANCVMWCEADQATLTSGKVSSWTDLSGSGNHATQGTAGKRPTPAVDGNGFAYLDFVPTGSDGTTCGLVIPSGITFNRRAMTVVMIATNDDPTAVRVLFQAGSTHLWSYQTYQNYTRISDGGAYTPRDQSFASTFQGFAGTLANYVMRFGASQSEVWHNDTRDTCPLLDAGAGTGGLIGDFNAAPSYSWDGKIYAIAIYNRELTTAELRDVRQYFDRKYGRTGGINLVAIGDSITHGTKAGPKGDWVSWMRDSSSLAGRIHASNLGVPSAQLNAMNTNAGPIADALRDATSRYNVLAVFGGSNDLYPDLGNQSAATALSRLSTLIGARSGWDVILVINLLPRQSNATFYGRRNTFNPSLIPGTYGNAIVNIAANPLIGDEGDENSATYYDDTIHPKAAGQAIIGATFDAILSPLVPANLVWSSKVFAAGVWAAGSHARNNNLPGT